MLLTACMRGGRFLGIILPKAIHAEYNGNANCKYASFLIFDNKIYCDRSIRKNFRNAEETVVVGTFFPCYTQKKTAGVTTHAPN